MSRDNQTNAKKYADYLAEKAGNGSPDSAEVLDTLAMAVRADRDPEYLAVLARELAKQDATAQTLAAVLDRWALS